MTTDALPQLQAYCRADAVRLRRVSAALSRWEKWACAQAVPAEISTPKWSGSH